MSAMDVSNTNSGKYKDDQVTRDTHTSLTTSHISHTTTTREPVDGQFTRDIQTSSGDFHIQFVDEEVYVTPSKMLQGHTNKTVYKHCSEYYGSLVELACDNV